jgi:hypothetical protein
MHIYTQKHFAEGSCFAFCLGKAQTKTLNQNEFWWSEDVRNERRNIKSCIVIA